LPFASVRQIFIFLSLTGLSLASLFNIQFTTIIKYLSIAAEKYFIFFNEMQCAGKQAIVKYCKYFFKKKAGNASNVPAFKSF